MIKPLLRRLLSLSTVLTLHTGLALAQDARQEIDRLEDLRYEAMRRGDWSTYEALHADDWVYHRADGAVVPKARYMAELRAGGGGSVKRALRKDVTTRLYGDTAVVMGKTEIDAEVGGQVRTFYVLFLNVWVRREGRWQVVARESTFEKR